MKMKIHADAGQGNLGSAFSSIIAGKNVEEIYWLLNVDVQVKLCTTAKPSPT